MTRVLVTRPEPSDGPLATALAGAGLFPVAAATFAFTEPATKPDADVVARFDWAVWTSAKAVDIVAPSSHAATRHAVVGPATAAALRSHGIEPDIVGVAGAADLADLVADAIVAPTHIIHPRSARADGRFAASLRARGHVVEDPVAYDVVPGNGAAVRAALATGVDVISFASPSAIHGLIDLLGTSERPGSDTLLATIGTTTRDACRTILRDPDIEAAEPTFEALAQAIVEVLDPIAKQT